MSNQKITPAHVTAMAAVRSGVNVFHPALARLLREVKDIDPALIDIYSPRELKELIGCTDADIYHKGQMCYFGAVLTPKGREILQERSAEITRDVLAHKMERPDPAVREIIQSAMQDELPNDPSLKIPPPSHERNS